jgi:histone acetyltransferase 1
VGANIDIPGTTSSTKAMTVSLVSASPAPAEPRVISTFNPKFTYPIFGDEERIFGYQNLNINLRFHANDMRPNVKVTYSKKFRAVGETEATDIDGILHDFLPQSEWFLMLTMPPM